MFSKTELYIILASLKEYKERYKCYENRGDVPSLQRIIKEEMIKVTNLINRIEKELL
jgi:hypothetical protein